MTPQEFSRGGLVACHESANALVRAGYPGDHRVFHHQRSQRASVVLRLLGHRRFPSQTSRGPVERDQMRVVGDEEDLVVADGHAAIGPQRRITHQAARLRARVFPDFRARQRVEGIHLVRTRDIHHAIGFERRDLQTKMRNRKEPLQSQRGHIGGVDLFQLAIAVRAEIAVVGQPVAGLRIAPGNPPASGARRPAARPR